MAVKIYPKGSSEKLSENFRAYEFDCRCGRCTVTKIDTDLVDYLQQIRDHFGVPVSVTSYRCPDHNAEVPNAAKNSYHTYGMAADTTTKGVEPAEVAKYAESIGVQGIGLYEKADCGDSFVHIDTRTTKSFWYGHKGERRTTFGGAPQVEAVPTEMVSVDLPVLSKGAKNDSVKALQLLLIGNGYSCGKAGADGDFGNGTETALLKYQKAHDMAENGKTQAEVWESLLGK